MIKRIAFVVLLLIAIFTGGCSLYFLIGIIFDAEARGYFGGGVLIFAIPGLLFTIFAFSFVYRFSGDRPSQGEDDGH